MVDTERLHHSVPRLDAPDRVWLVPVPIAKWLAAGALSGPAAATLTALNTGMAEADAWNLPAVWLVWALGLLLSVVGAFVRPGGLHAAAWAVAWSDYVLSPRRAVWSPVRQ